MDTEKLPQGGYRETCIFSHQISTLKKIMETELFRGCQTSVTTSNR